MSVFVGKSMCVAVTKARAHNCCHFDLSRCVDVCFIHFNDESGWNAHSHHWLCEPSFAFRPNGWCIGICLSQQSSTRSIYPNNLTISWNDNIAMISTWHSQDRSAAAERRPFVLFSHSLTFSLSSSRHLGHFHIVRHQMCCFILY